MTVVYSRAEIKQYRWEAIGSIIASQAALENDKSADLVNALDASKRIILTPDDGTAAFELRFRGGSNNEINVLNVYAMRDDNDHYALIATLTITTGQQTDGTYNFIDTIDKSAAADSWPDNGIETMSTGNDSIARMILNTYGYKKFLFIAPTLASLNIEMEAARV